MADLGLYNFFKRELALGRSKEEIFIQLQAVGHNQRQIEEAYTSVLSGEVPNSTPASSGQLSAQVQNIPVIPHRQSQVIALLSFILGCYVIWRLTLWISGMVTIIASDLLSQRGLFLLATLTPLVCLCFVVYGLLKSKKWGFHLLSLVILVSFGSLVLEVMSAIPYLADLLRNHPLDIFSFFTVTGIVTFSAWLIALNHLNEMS